MVTGFDMSRPRIRRHDSFPGPKRRFEAEVNDQREYCRKERGVQTQRCNGYLTLTGELRPSGRG
jgi:hypothetical protein